MKTINATVCAAELAARAGDDPVLVYRAQIQTRLRLVQLLEREIDELRMLRGHEHEPDGDGFCTICGTDGRV